MSIEDFRLGFQFSPIILTGGIATNLQGGALPIISITQGSDFESGVLSGGNVDVNKFFASFEPLPGATLIDQDIGEYPFANQTIAANATISKPLEISMRMICPARTDGNGFANKLAVITALQGKLAQHNGSGGTYTIATPSFYYTDCVMLGMSDVSAGESKQPQTAWQLDFRQPLLTLAQAQQAESNLMSKITNGTQVAKAPDGEVKWSGPDIIVGQPASLVAGSIIPAASGAPGAGVSGPFGAA